MAEGKEGTSVTRSVLEQTVNVAASLEAVRRNTLTAHKKSSFDSKEPRVVAVSKTKTVETILEAYQSGQRHFGETYVQELVEKAKHPLLSSCADIHWHYIGHLQRNKCNRITSIPALWAVETVDSERIASSLNDSWKRQGHATRLRVFVQINTSGEASKNGCSDASAPVLVKHIVQNCPELEFTGLMTIGRIGHDYSKGRNPDFECMLRTRETVCEELGVDPSSVELSMGMSADYQEAVLSGSTNIRVGSIIFGAREPKK